MLDSRHSPNGAEQVNPYRAPSSATSANTLSQLPFYFQGSMTLEEGRHVGLLLKGKKPSVSFSPPQLIWSGLGALALLGYFAYDSIVYDELDQLVDVALPLLAVAGILLGSFWTQRKDLVERTELKRKEKGVFTPMAGRIDETGVEFLMGDIPIRYQWSDFVCSRSAADVILLYVEYPKALNFLAESMFASQQDWITVKAMILDSVPSFSKFRLPGSYKPNSRMTHLAAGIGALQTNVYAEAAQHFDNVLSMDPSNLQALRGKAIALTCLQDNDGAMLAIDELVKHGPIDTSTRRIRCALLLAGKRYGEAFDDLQVLIETTPVDPDLLRDRGLASLKMGHLDAALADTSQSIELNPNDFIALNNRGAILLEMGRPADAIADLEQSIRLNPEFDRPRELLAKATSLIKSTTS